MGNFLSRDQILDASDITTEVVEVEEWGGAVRVRGLSGNERDTYEQSIITMKGTKIMPKFTGAMAKLVALSVVDEQGVRMFTDEDVRALGRKSAGALQRVYEVARRLAGLSSEDMEEILGNSDGVQNESPISDSLSL